MDYLCLNCGVLIRWIELGTEGGWTHVETQSRKCDPPFYGSAKAFRD